MQNSSILYLPTNNSREITYNNKVLATVEVGSKDINGSIKPTLKITKIRAVKPYVNYYFQNIDQLNKKLLELELYLIEAEKRKIENKIKRSSDAEKFRASLNEGDILFASWGYDQTNVEFYKIIKLNKAKTRVELIELSHVEVVGSVEPHGMACKVIPGLPMNENEVTKRVIMSDYIKLDRSIYLQKWNNLPKYKSWYA